MYITNLVVNKVRDQHCLPACLYSVEITESWRSLIAPTTSKDDNQGPSPTVIKVVNNPVPTRPRDNIKASAVPGSGQAVSKSPELWFRQTGMMAL